MCSTNIRHTFCIKCIYSFISKSKQFIICKHTRNPRSNRCFLNLTCLSFLFLRCFFRSFLYFFSFLFYLFFLWFGFILLLMRDFLISLLIFILFRSRTSRQHQRSYQDSYHQPISFHILNISLLLVYHPEWKQTKSRWIIYINVTFHDLWVTVYI